MRKNSKRSKSLSVWTLHTMNAAGVILMLFVMVIVNLLASSSGNRMVGSIREKERELARLEDERTRESARWEEMKTPEKLEIALVRNGLSMRSPRPDQVIRMRADGRPYPGQLSVNVAAKRRSAASPVAMNTKRSRR